MVWADRIVEEIGKRFAAEIKRGEPLLIRDEKTLSGPVHVGSLRGFVIHSLIHQVLKEKGIQSEYRYEFNDVDPMDALPPVHAEEFKAHMGKPLYTVPSPSASHLALRSYAKQRATQKKDSPKLAKKNYPEYYGAEFKSVLEKLGIDYTLYFLKPEYEAGKFNDCIRDALNYAEEIRTIYAQVSGGKKPLDWFPVSVICEQCGRVGTTQVTSWNGKEVTYECKENLVTWARGCGYKGKTSPFNERGKLRSKLPWKVEWAAKWKVFGVKIEGAGKDHSAAGGSRAIAARISEEIFHYPNPFDIPYEFFNIGGKKMSASKGLGATAKDIADLLPPTLLKLLMIRKQPNQPIDFDPEGTTIPTLFDEYDRLADHYFKRHPEPDADYARTFALTQIDAPREAPQGGAEWGSPKPPQDLFQMRFTTLSFILQMPHLNVEEEAKTLKGSALSDDEKHMLRERSHYVGQWLKIHAPEEYKYEILKAPPKDLPLDSEQKTAFENVLKALSDPSLPWEGPKLHEAIHKVKKELGIAPKKLFEPLYQIFLGRSSGPQVGWFLSTLTREEVLQRITNVL